jgi:hypothetical protein
MALSELCALRPAALRRDCARLSAKTATLSAPSSAAVIGSLLQSVPTSAQAIVSTGRVRGRCALWKFTRLYRSPLLLARYLRVNRSKPRRGDHQMFSLTSSNLTRVQSHHSSARAAHSLETIAAAAVVLLASASTLSNAAENLARLAREQHACAVVLGLDPSGRRYDVCIRSLDKSLSELDQARLATRLDEIKRSACAQNGLTPGTPAFAACVVNAEQSSVNAGSYGGGVPLR